ncbi:hypothetical protein [Paraburkholderia fungorum]
MANVDLATVEKVVAAIKDEHDPQAQREALIIRSGFRRLMQDCLK